MTGSTQHILAVLALLAGTASGAHAQDVAVSPDVTISLSNGTVVQDESVVEVTAGPPGVVDLGPLPPGVDVEGYHFDGESVFFTLDTIAELPQAGGNLIVESRDIVKLGEGSYGIAFKGANAGIPRGVGIDAVTQVGEKFVMSFDTTVDLGGLIVHDEDLVIEDTGSLALFLDASDFEISSSLDLDAVHVLANGDIVASFDGHGKVENADFADEDAIVFDGGEWASFLVGLNLDDDFGASDVNALLVLTSAPGPLFADGFESGDTSAWSSTVL